jgi:hypothetical protein
MNKIKFLALQAASEAFGNRIEDIYNWIAMSEPEMEQWCWENASEPVEGMDGKAIMDLISCHAYTIEETILTTLDLLKEKIIQRDVDKTLPTCSMSELNLNELLDFHDERTPSFSP